MSSEVEWVEIPNTLFEINKNGDVRNKADKVIQKWGRTLFIYGGAHNSMRRAMHKIVRETFGDDAVDGVALKREDKRFK